ncbi:MAG: hypothetical protein JST08_03795 [Actinobacteria bacterium]|nr:hypothetical protein [Actinomycetota bacterium]
MSALALVVRRRSCAPASAVELTDWLEGKVAQLQAGHPPVPVRLARLVQDLPTSTVEDGWLIEVQLDGGRPGHRADPLPAPLEEILSDMRILGLDPTLLVPLSDRADAGELLARGDYRVATAPRARFDTPGRES